MLCFRNPTLVIEEKTLRLAHRFTQDSDHNTYSCLLFASLLTDTGKILFNNTLRMLICFHTSFIDHCQIEGASFIDICDIYFFATS